MDRGHGALDARMRRKNAFDFAQFDTYAPDFDLMVAPSKKFNTSVVTVTSHIAREIDDVVRIIGPRAFYKAPRVLRVRVDVASRPIRSSHYHFAEFANSAGRCL